MQPAAEGDELKTNYLPAAALGTKVEITAGHRPGGPSGNAEVGQAPGCVSAACRDGLAALIRRLDTGFAALDGQDLDFFLSGDAPMVDRDGDGSADALGGSTSGIPSSVLVAPGLWSASFRSRSGITTIYGSWTAEQAPAPVPVDQVPRALAAPPPAAPAVEIVVGAKKGAGRAGK